MSDYQVGDTIYHKFTTRAFASGVPTVLAGSPVVSIYEDDSITQITAGITLSVDFDGVVGLNHLTVVATGANGFETGKFYQAVITTGTVSAVSVVGEIVWTFSLEAAAAALDLANATDGLGALKALIDTVNTDLSNGTDGLGALKTLIDALPAATDIVSAGAITTLAGAIVNVDLVDTTTALTNVINAASVVASVSGAVGSVTGAVGSVTGHTAQTGDTYALANGASGFVPIGNVVAAILVDTADMQPRVTAIEVDTSTTLQAELDAIQAAVITNAAGVDIAADIIALKAETVLIVADTNELQTDWVDGGRLDLIQDIIAADTTTDIPALIATAQADLDTLTGSDGATLATAQGNYAPAKAADILTTALTESYAADGAAATLTQLLYLIQQALTEFSIAGTTTTIKKIDGSTTAATLTLSDATNPTSATRAT